ncbi:MAG: RagB/SusD family nutrient uptake outer membrane protein [Bacteroidota bacterium]
MKSIFNYITCCLLAVFMLTATSCDIEFIENPNGPTLESLENGATLADIRLLAQGLESVMRVDLEFYIQSVSIVGREYWDLNGIDPRFTGELLGEQGAVLDNNGFLTTRTFAARYRAIRNAWTLRIATENANAGLSAEQESAIQGYAKTMQAYALLLCVNHQFSNGIRPADAVRDPDALGGFLDYTASLVSISELLDDAATNLTNGGTEFVFDLSSGFAGFNTPATFRQFNRAIAARVKLYQGDKAGAVTAIAGSFFNINGDLSTGASHAYGTGGNDIRNPMFYVPNQDLFTVHPDVIADAEAGDLRVTSKTTPYDPGAISVPVSLADLSGDTQVQMFGSDTESFPIINNEELILIYAEAQIGSDVNEVLAGINRVRNAAGLGNYLGATDDASLLNEVIHQRRYSLYGLGHRWVDLRRTGKFGEINVDRPGDVVHMEFPRPVSEN